MGAKWGPPVDIWNLGCLVRTLLPNMTTLLTALGFTVVLPNVDQIVEWTTGGSLFQYDTDTWNPQQILEHMVRAFGHFPPELIAKGRFASKWFNADGQWQSLVQCEWRLSLLRGQVLSRLHRNLLAFRWKACCFTIWKNLLVMSRCAVKSTTERSGVTLTVYP